MYSTGLMGLDEVLDILLDQEGLEVDPVDRLERDIPLHKAVRFVNGLAKEEWGAGAGVVELLLDAGADPRSVLTFSFFLRPVGSSDGVRAREWRFHVGRLPARTQADITPFAHDTGYATKRS